MAHYEFPVDPNCSKVEEFHRDLSEDPAGSSFCPSDVFEDIIRDFEKKHQARCKRCQEYGCANVEAVY